ncbi:hypothetical protein [Aliagarivorans marinus]|uniref:hypothetical protein n=1 Tax=Aliagarivorans marinus TaxID=561965 RepID=UPI000415A2DF|nr:hypothetical protein [Aliagarivorans marinus]
MQVGGSSVAQALEVKSLQMAQGRQQQEGAAAQELIAATEPQAPKPSSNLSLGQNVDLMA